jgi:hypothetical protein
LAPLAFAFGTQTGELGQSRTRMGKALLDFLSLGLSEDRFLLEIDRALQGLAHEPDDSVTRRELGIDALQLIPERGDPCLQPCFLRRCDSGHARALFQYELPALR